jgi:tRNA (cytidine/uridine-2'-O-)-methyltransferase
MLHIALWEPEIPPNTGNIARLCAATGTRLHLIGRLGFRLDERSLRRAGIDYWDAVDVVRHVTFEEFESSFFSQLPVAAPGDAPRSGTELPRAANPSALPIPEPSGTPHRIWCVETPGERLYTQAHFQDGDCLLFGSESRGLPPQVRNKYAATLIGIPMPSRKVRSLNLATAAGIVLYEALRQLHNW